MSDEENRLDLEAWEPQLPPQDFAERVLEEVRQTPAAPPKKSRGRVYVFGAAIAAIAAGTLLYAGRAPSKGEAIAKDDRVEIQMGSRAKAVLEPNTHLTWNGDDVTQDRGDVFYRVEPGEKFKVHTPAGDVEVKGTCFTVKVRGDEMNKRDAKSAAIGAGLTALAFVIVYEGKVAVSHAQSRVDLAAGESATVSADGASKNADAASGEKAFTEKSVAVDDANANLVGQVQEYRRRLELIANQKTEVEKKLEDTQKKLAATTDAAVRTRSDYDLDKDDWIELAKKGEIKYQLPCLKAEGYKPDAEKLSKLGLAPSDAPAISEAYDKNYQRVWNNIRPLCSAALGTTDAIVEKIGPTQCIHLVYELAEKDNKEAAGNAMAAAAEVRAGLRPEPGPNEKVPAVEKMFLFLTSATSLFEADLAKTFGPEDAHRMTYSENSCSWRSHWGNANSVMK